MFPKVVFFSVLGLVLLLPMILLLLGQYWTKEAIAEFEQDRSDQLNFARKFGWIASVMPGLFTLSTLLFALKVQNLRVYVTLGCPIAGVLFGLASILLFGLSARSLERWTGPLAGLLSAALSLLLFLLLGRTAA
jgi:hypothetical protein